MMKGPLFGRTRGFLHGIGNAVESIEKQVDKNAKKRARRERKAEQKRQKEIRKYGYVKSEEEKKGIGFIISLLIIGVIVVFTWKVDSSVFQSIWEHIKDFFSSLVT